MSRRALRTTIAPPPAPPVQIGIDGTPVAPVPVVPDVITRLDPTRNTSSNSGDTTMIDVHPDFRFPLISWMYSLCHSIQSSVYNTHPLASPASVLCYTQIMFVGLLFHNDAFLRFVPSNYAFAIRNNEQYSLIYDLMLDLAVPAFAVADFEAFMTHMDDLATNLFYFGTLAGSSFYHDFGRFPPATMFATLHNLLSILPNNVGYSGLAANFYASTVAEVTLEGLATPNVNLTPSNFLGTFMTTDRTTNQKYNNWFNFRLDQFITANAIRVVNASATVTRLPLHLPARTSTTNYNPYLYGIGLHEDSLMSFTELLRNLNDFIMTAWPSSRPLRAFTQYGTQEISRHLIFQSVLPTWHNGATPSLATLSTNNYELVNAVPDTNAHFAEHIQFLARRPAPANDTVPPSVPVAVGVNQEGDTSNLIQLVCPATSPPTTEDPAELRTFSPTSHVLPRCLIFDPASSATAHLTAVITSGKIIETNDLSCIGVVIPTALRPLGSTNSDYIQGAIPLRHVQPGITHVPWSVRRRQDSSSTYSPQVILRSFASKITIPRFRTGLVRPATTLNTQHPRLQPFLPGVTTLDNLLHAHDGINVFASALGTINNTVPDQFFQVWSCYRFYHQESRTWYMLPSLRHIYGTRARHFVSEHPALRIN